MSRTRRGAWGWAFYDWANSAFILSVLTVFYGDFFIRFWHGGDPAQAGVLQGLSVTLSSLVVAALAPFLGTIADSGPVKKRWLATFAGLGVVSTIGLALIPAGGWPWALFLRLTASMGFFGSLVFYDALLTDVSTRKNRHIVSALGFSLGYLGSVLLFIGQFLIVKDPGLIGLSSAATAVRLSFLAVAVWWALFTLPLLLSVKEQAKGSIPPLSVVIRTSGSHLLRNARLVYGHRPAFLFLVAYFFYIDGVNTLMHMVSSFAASIGVPRNDLMGAIILVQIVGVPCALILGFIGQRCSVKALIYGCIAVYFGVTAYAWRFSGEPVSLFGFEVSEIYLLGLLIGSVQGGLQALSRSYFANLIPTEKSAAFFGFYNMLGKGGAILGPLLMTGVGLALGDPRWGALAIASLFAAGFFMLLRAPHTPQREAPRSAP